MATLLAQMWEHETLLKVPVNWLVNKVKVILFLVQTNTTPYPTCVIKSRVQRSSLAVPKETQVSLYRALKECLGQQSTGFNACLIINSTSNISLLEDWIWVILASLENVIRCLVKAQALAWQIVKLFIGTNRQTLGHHKLLKKVAQAQIWEVKNHLSNIFQKDLPPNRWLIKCQSVVL